MHCDSLDLDIRLHRKEPIDKVSPIFFRSCGTVAKRNWSKDSTPFLHFWFDCKTLKFLHLGGTRLVQTKGKTLVRCWSAVRVLATLRELGICRSLMKADLQSNRSFTEYKSSCLGLESLSPVVSYHYSLLLLNCWKWVLNCRLNRKRCCRELALKLKGVVGLTL